MNPQTFHEHTEQHRKFRRIALALDEALGTHHGIGWADLLLLDLVQAEGGHITAARAAACQGLTPTRLLLQALPMEQLGLLRRTRNPEGARELTIASAGKRALQEATYTAEAVLTFAP
jgi:DNA-binding MarR family transcriptional regulator